MKSAPLKKGNLTKLGQLSLKDKIKTIAGQNDDEVEAAMVLREEMTPAEKNGAWQQHVGYLNKKGNEAEKQEFEASTKKEKGLKTALYLMRQGAAKFCAVSRQSSMETSLCKKEQWLSEKQALDQWGQGDLDKHVASGRVIYRQAPGTHNVWEYMDTQDYTRAHTGKKMDSWLYTQEYQQQEEGKGKGKGKGKGEKPLPLEDMPAEQQLHECMKKLKKTK
ncbi:Uncharacterized protein SCF082_LOCUS11809, partial [Durusdinium trenchii]